MAPLCSRAELATTTRHTHLAWQTRHGLVKLPSRQLRTELCRTLGLGRFGIAVFPSWCLTLFLFVALHFYVRI